MSDAQRIQKDIDYLRRCSENCMEGTTRVGFTKEYRLAADYVRRQMEEAGLLFREDEIGNFYGRREGSSPDLPVILTGSHLDTVRCAGAYDGIAGIVCGLEAARLLKENNVTLQHPFEVLALNEEEGTRFGQVLLGSQFITGLFGDHELDFFQDSKGILLREARDLYSAHDAVPCLRKEDEIKAFIELHDEQGPVLEKEGIDIGIVKSIVAISWLTVRVCGFAGHAGTVPMSLRQDALTGACQMICRITEYTARKYSETATATVGKLDVLPGSTNCIPAECSFTVDLRAGEKGIIDALTDYIRTLAKDVAEQYNLQIEVNVDSYKEPVRMNDTLGKVIRSSCQDLGLSCREMNSGAGHDAMIMAKKWPTAMLFLPCDGGITHNPKEYVSPDALKRGADALYQTILKVDKMEVIR